MMRSRKRSGFCRTASALLGVLLAAPSVVLACPSCKDAISGDPVASALSWTTLVLIAMPLVLIGSIGGWVGYVYWRAARGSHAADGATPQPIEIAEQPVS